MSDVTVQDEPVKKVDLDIPSAPTGSVPVISAESAVPVAGSHTLASTPIPTPPPAPRQTMTGETAFNENIIVYSGNRLPQYDKGAVKAYVAHGSDKVATNLFAMICEDHLMPRALKAANYAAILNPSLPRLVASGAIDWPPAGKEKYCFIYENTLGNQVMKDDLHGCGGLKPDLVLNGVIKPLIGVLQDFHDKDIVHGNIRPSNLFDGNGRNLDRVVLGECLALPVSYNQPAIYEPIDRALSSAAGRGTGTQQDDLYSLGVTLAVLMRHNDPTEGMSDEEIVERKMEEGSYITLLGRDRFSGAILELLRGLLYDDENQRWTLDEVLVWLDGRRLSPKQAARRSKANRPLLFNGGKYIRPELLARDLNKNITEARQIIDAGEMEQWMARALEDKVATARYEKALKQSEEGGKGPGYAERLITRVAIALHPEGPIRFKSVNVSPDGTGAALAEAYVMKRDLQTWVDFFMNYFITQWVDAQSSAVPDVTNLISKFDGARAYLRQKTLGSGIEKCIYSLCPEIHCLSEKLGKYHVRTPEEMMYAFEKLSKSPSRPTLFFDRHIVAFLSVKDRKNIDPYLHDMNAPEQYRRILAEVKTLATIQKRSSMEKFPGIAAWMLDNLGPVYERFHDRELREEIRKKAEHLKEGGELARIVMLFDSPSVYQEDNISFRKAMRKHHDLEQEMLEIEKELRDESTLGRDTGHQVAAVVAGILAGIIIMATAFTTIGSHAPPF